MTAIHLFFHWPDGGVWSNIIASFLWATPAFIAQHVLLKRHINKKHQEHMRNLHKIHKHLGIDT